MKGKNWAEVKSKISQAMTVGFISTGFLGLNSLLIKLHNFNKFLYFWIQIYIFIIPNI